MFGDALRARLEVLQTRQAGLQARLQDIARGAALRAVEEAQACTPPNGGDTLRGVNMITGELAQHWASDSQAEPVQTGGRYTSLLANEKEYASYVNDGHRMDRHFVPGLYIDSRGLLSRDLSRDVGLTVGTKTGYVPGLHMKEQAVQAYEDAAASGLEALGKEIFL
ncbi:MAG: HK97 gp10 family phage protein [Oscillospiraceae bacterium]|nr:HK97 gp10 family phage protein [Oscillospiraceae bacterium]